MVRGLDGKRVAAGALISRGEHLTHAAGCAVRADGGYGPLVSLVALRTHARRVRPRARGRPHRVEGIACRAMSSEWSGTQGADTSS